MEPASFIFYASFKKAAEQMSDRNRLAFYDAISRYGIEGKEPQNLNKTVLQCWLLVKPQLDSNNKKYEDGKKGGRPAKTSGLQEQETTGLQTEKPNVNVNVNENENVNVNEKVKEKNTKKKVGELPDDGTEEKRQKIINQLNSI